MINKHKYLENKIVVHIFKEESIVNYQFFRTLKGCMTY